jgi:hypothetical protein
MAYSAFTSGEVDQDSPLDATFFTKMKDNFDSLRDGSGFNLNNDVIPYGAIASGAVGQNELKTSSEEDSTTSSTPTPFVTSAGSYGFVPRGRASTSSTVSITALGGRTNDVSGSGLDTYASYVTVSASSSETGYAETYYVTASPPYDLGDGQIDLFSWVLMDSNNQIKAIQTSITPPWAYNGPTDIRPDKTIKGKKIKTRKEINEKTGEIITAEFEVTMAFKNSDMNLIPHPFVGIEGNDTVILLDPPEMGYLAECREAGLSINSLLHDDYLRIDNTPINRACPQGVLPCGFKWRDTQRKAGAAADRRLKNEA